MSLVGTRPPTLDFGITGDKKLMFNNELTPGSGLFLQIDGKKIIMDPGPGTFCAFNL